MTEDISSYQLNDFIMFSEDVYNEVFRLYFNQIWPFPFVSLGLSIFIFYLLVRKEKSLWVFLLMAVLWIFLGYFFYSQQLQSITWVAQYLAYACYIEGALLMGLAFISKATPDQKVSQRYFGKIGLLIFFLAAFVPFSWPPFVFGYDPFSTALGTVALLTLRLRFGTFVTLSLIPASVAVFHFILLWHFSIS